MKYNFYLDESGDHSLKNISKDFPYFCLCGILINEKSDLELNNLVNEIKKIFFGNTDIILHSSNIRKKDGVFKILLDEETNINFINDINLIFKNIDFKIFAIIVDKNEYVKKYGLSGISPYDLSLSYIIERIIYCTNNKDSIYIKVEKRGKNEDKKLLNHYNFILSNGTGFIKGEEIKNRIKKFDFRSKKLNDNGIQIADLCANPIVRTYKDKKENPAYKVLKNKLHKKNGKIFGVGIKIIP